MKNTFYFPHDYHARHDPKLEKLRMELGPVSDGIFWNLVEMLYEQNGYLLMKEIPLYAKMMNSDEQMLNKVIKEAFLTDGDRFYNQSLLDRLNHINKVREERSLAGKSSGKVRQKNICSTNDERLMNNINKSKVKESKVNKIKDNTMSTEVDPYQQVFKVWNERMPWKVNRITESRRRKLALRLKDPSFVDNFNTILSKILESDFLMGNCPTEKHKHWHASFDWLIENDTNFVKVLEGKYDNRELTE